MDVRSTERVAAMQAEPKENPKTASDANAADDAKREQSAIAFPYADLDTAVGVARDIQQIGGQSCEAEQLAGFWKVAATGGAFRGRYAPARTFGLLNVEKGRFSLTPLGMRIVDRTQEQAARIDAFLYVALYKAIYEKYRNYQLPGPPALEGEIVRLGVAQKQATTARQVFVRAARQAGFFWAGEDRLVRPNTPQVAQPETLSQEAADRTPQPEREQNGAGRSGGSNSGGGGQYHPFIQGLLQTLPEPGTVWTVEGRAAWLQAAAQNFMLMYKGDGKIDVQVAAPAKIDKAAA